MSYSYKETINDECQKKIDELLDQLPGFYVYYVTAYTRLRSRRTIKQYLQLNLVFLRYLCDKHPHFCDLHPKEITPDDLTHISLVDANQFLNYMYSHQADNPVHINTNNTVETYVSAINAVWNYLTKNGYIENNPFSLVERKHESKDRPLYLEGNENIRYYDAILTGEGLTKKQLEYRDHQHSAFRDYVICRLLGTTGIRVSELVGLDLDDIDIQKAKFSVIRKGGREDTVYMSDQMRQELIEYLEDVRPLFYPTDDERAVFLISQGKLQGQRLGVKSVESLVKKYAKAIGLADASHFTPHKLRHTYAMNALSATGDIRKVQQTMGHKRIETTTIYARVLESDIEKSRNAGEYTGS
jgi:site-specific recombinase XerD